MGRRGGGERLDLRVDALVGRVQAVQRLLHVPRHLLRAQVAPQRLPRGERLPRGGRAEVALGELEEELDGEVGVVVAQRGLVGAEAQHLLEEQQRVEQQLLLEVRVGVAEGPRGDARRVAQTHVRGHRSSSQAGRGPTSTAAPGGGPTRRWSPARRRAPG